jgi:DNA-binding transcriptional LysR family regulator
MRLNNIELFISVAKHKNLGDTAGELHVSASSVCQRLKSLENDLGVRLYKKSRQGIELTVAGKTFFTAGAEVLDDLETLRRKLSGNPSSADDHLSVGGTFTPSVKHLPSAIAAFQKTYPAAKLKFLSAHRAVVEQWVRDGEVDLALIQSSTKCTDLVMEEFGEDSLTFFALPAHPLAKKKRLGLHDLKNVPLVVREGQRATAKLLKELERLDMAPNITLRCATPQAVIASVTRKMGVGILSSGAIEEELKRNDFIALKFPGLKDLLRVPSYLVYSKKRPLSPMAADFLRLLRSKKRPAAHLDRADGAQRYPKPRQEAGQPAPWQPDSSKL